MNFDPNLALANVLQALSYAYRTDPTPYSDEQRAHIEQAAYHTLKVLNANREDTAL